jgi:hypothetical protein
MQIFFRNFRYGQRPRNPKGWIIMANTADRSWLEGRGNEVSDLDVITECLEAMGESVRDVELMVVPARKLKLLPFEIRRRTGPDINDDVQNGSLNATQQLNFGVRSALVMHTSQSSPTFRVRNTVLWIVGLKPARRELFCAERPGEKTPIVARELQPNEPSITECCWLKLHRIYPKLIFQRL